MLNSLIQKIKFPFLPAWLLVFAAGGCSENIDNSSGLLLVPQGKTGALPQVMEFHQVLEVFNPAGNTIGKGDQSRILTGRSGRYRMRSLLSFLFELPEDVEIVSGTLRLYVLAINGEKPVNLAVHLLQKEFVEAEVTWEQASSAAAWSAPGGDIAGTPLGGAVYEGVGLDTIIVSLDKQALDDFLKPGSNSVPLAVINDGGDNYLSLVSREYIPTQAVASRLDLEFKLSGGTTSSFIERRAYQDATIIEYVSSGVDSGLLSLGELPARQLLFSYDLSGLPPFATVNQARIHLSIAGTSFIDSFLVASAYTDTKSYVDPGRILVGTQYPVGSADTSLVLDVSVAMQNLILGGSSTGNYLVLASFTPSNIAGFLEIYPPDWPEAGRRPYLSLIYTDAPEAAKPNE